jgi:nicotinate-nucleotide adenylyltransferase
MKWRNLVKYEKMEFKLKKSLDIERYIHTKGVEKTARQMARCFGVDEEKAGLAGLLHDCAKCLSLDKMNKAVKDYPVDDLMRENKSLLHSAAGRCLAESVYGVKDQDVLEAIRWHTTGHAGMSKLEKIVYLADIIEPSRKPFPGIEELRRLCKEDLDKAMHAALLMSLRHVASQGKTLHPDTLAALGEYEPTGRLTELYEGVEANED